MSQPTILIIPGSFSPPSMYHKLVENLQSHGYEAIVEPLQSATRNDPAPSASMYDDAAHFRNVISKLADQGKEIVLLPHSYGGIVANESAKGLLKSDRAQKGQNGGIVRIINIATLIPDLGESALDKVGSLGFDQIPIDNGYMVLDEEYCAQANYHDVPAEQGLEFARQHSNHSLKSFKDPLTYAAYVDVPSDWILTERDQLITPEMQLKSVKLMEEKSGKKVRVFKSDGSHCVNMTQPKELADLVERILSE